LVFPAATENTFAILVLVLYSSPFKIVVPEQYYTVYTSSTSCIADYKYSCIPSET